MVDLIEVNPRSYYLDDGLKMDSMYMIFMYVMLSEFSYFWIVFALMTLEAIGAGISGSYFLKMIFVLIYML